MTILSPTFHLTLPRKLVSLFFMRLSEVYPFLSHLSLSPRQVARYNRMISRGTSYAARLTAQERAILIRLLREEQFLPGMAHVITEKLTTVKDGGSLPSLLFAVLAPDWAGLSDACLGTVHEAGLNIAYMHGFILRRSREKLGALLMEVEIAPSITRKALDMARSKIQERLSRIAAEDTAKKALQQQEARRLYAFTTVTDLLKPKVSAEDLKELMGDSGEVLKFFVARQESYINDRPVEKLAEQVLACYALKKRIRSGASNLEFDFQDIPVRDRVVTGFTLITREADVTFERILRQLEEVVPGYRRYHDYAYFTADRISVFHVEFTDADDRPLDEDARQILCEAVRKLPGTQEALGPTPGVELVRRKIVPLMLDEEKELKIPQGYFHPHAPDHFKVILVASGPDAGFGIEVVRALSGEPGFSAAMPDKPSFVTYTRDDHEVRQEISIIDLWVDRKALFGPDQGRWNDEEIYNRVEARIKTIAGFGPKLRVFDRTSRVLRQMRLKAVTRMADGEGIDPAALKSLFYNLGDRCLLSPEIGDDVVFAQIKLGCRIQKQFRPARTVAVEAQRIRLKEGEPETTMVAVAVANQPQAIALVLDQAKAYQVHSLCRADYEQATVLLINLSDDGRPLKAAQVDALARQLKAALSSPAC